MDSLHYTYILFMMLLYSLHSAKSSVTLVFSRNFSVQSAPLSVLGTPIRTQLLLQGVDNGAQCTKNLQLNTYVSEDFAE